MFDRIPKTPFAGVPPRGAKTVWRAASAMVLAAWLLGCGPELPLPAGHDGFRAANERIERYDGLVGFGNSSRAATLAQRIAHMARAARDEHFTIDNQAGDRAYAPFLTYCQLTSDAACILIHVPELERFRDETRRQLLALCWECALVVLSGELPPRSELAIALRGKHHYGASAIGRIDGDPSVRQSSWIDTDPLCHHFVDD